MEKIQVNHSPASYAKKFAITFLFLWVIFTLIVINTKYNILLSSGFLFIIIGIAIYIDYKKTTVEYDTEKIQWKWLWFEYTVNFKDMTSFYYTIISERTRGGYVRHFEICFIVKNNEFKLNDLIKTEDIENSINGTPDNIHLMKLFKFIENIYPEKSEGFKRTEN